MARTRQDALEDFGELIAQRLADGSRRGWEGDEFLPGDERDAVFDLPMQTRKTDARVVLPLDRPPAGADALWLEPRERATDQPLIGEMMVERGLIRADDLAAALEGQQTSGRRIGELLVQRGALSSIQLTQILAERAGHPFMDLTSWTVDPVLVLELPDDVASNHCAIPIRRERDRFVVAMADPDDVFALDDLRVVTGLRIFAVMADRAQVEDAIERAYNRAEVVSSVDDAASDYAEEHDHDSEIGVEDAPIVRLLYALLEQAVDERASDIHIEPLSDRVRIRLRVDGVLHDASDTPRSLLRPLVSRVKVLSNIDITRRRVPQDGRFSLKVNSHWIDVRVVTLPTAHGEAVILRLLDQMHGVLDLPSAGLRGPELERFQRAFRSPQGAVIVSGATGSGKTSTLYTTLAELNTPDRSIVSVEDPVEYKLDGVKQIQVDARGGMTFASALRSILRADPDVVLVGEIRDSETAKIAAEAAITGHLVFSTLHTTRAAAVPMRLIDMGVEPYLVASALTCVATQRLVRQLCELCAVADDGGLAALRGLGCPDNLLARATVRRAVGCPACRGTGYQGRTGIYEVMDFSDDIARLVFAGASRHEIETRAVVEGMNTLSTNAIQRVTAGELTLEEMRRVIAG